MQTAGQGDNGIQPANERFFTPPLLIIFLTIFIDLVGFGIVIPLLTFYGEEMGATPLDIGLLVSSYSLMQFGFSPIWGALSDRFGRRPILFLTILGTSVGYLVLGLATSLWMVYAGRLISGIAGGNLATAQAYIADVTSRENRARGMGLFGMAFGLGFIIGPALAGVLSKFGMHVPFIFASGLSFANAALLYFILPESLSPDRVGVKREGRLRQMWSSIKNPILAKISLDFFLVVTAFSMMTTAFAYYTMVKFGYDAEKTGYLLGFVGLVAAVMQGGVFGVLAKRFGEVPLIAVGCVILTASLVAVPFVSAASGGLPMLLIGIAAFAIGNSISSPALTSLASKSANEAEQGQALGIMQSFASLARVIGPLLCGLLLNNQFNQVDDATILRTFWTAAGIMVAALVVSLFLRRVPKEKFS
ncbi:MAG: MFS transporter [Acidobacteriota bacterium]|nr:MAG: MFS transporter [Acidobacteriota bacterium]